MTSESLDNSFLLLCQRFLHTFRLTILEEPCTNGKSSGRVLFCILEGEGYEKISNIDAVYGSDSGNRF